MAGTAVAQSGAIQGSVIDKDFDAPLSGVTVTVLRTDLTATTDEAGEFTIPRVEAGKRLTLVFSKDGYTKQLREITVRAGAVERVDVALVGDFTDMEEIVVQDLLDLGGGSEASLLQLRFDSPSLLDSIGAELLSRSGASDAGDAIRYIAGASVQNNSAVIRGLPDRYVSSQMNGVRLPTADADKRAVELDQFPATVIESIQVSKTFTPDQQGDASGGAVNIITRSVPEEPFVFRYSVSVGRNSQAVGRGRFLTYDGGGVSFWGKDGGQRSAQFDNIGDNWTGAAGVREGAAPIDYKWNAALGGSHEIADGVRIGGFGSLFYERDSSFYDRGFDDSYWVDQPGGPLTPQLSQIQGSDDFRTRLFDFTRATQSVQWGGLTTAGVETDNHKVGVTYLFTRSAEDEVSLAEDTRGKEYYFPGHDPNDPSTPGHGDPDAAPYLRLETLQYTERTTGTLQFKGEHVLPIPEWGIFGKPEFDWAFARSSALSNRPDKRQFGSAWFPERQVGPPSLGLTIPAAHRPFKPGANFNLGNLQRIYQKIDEDSEQRSLDLTLPFSQWTDDGGYLKFGLFRDRVDRTFDQDTYSNFGDNSSFEGPWEQYWSNVFPFEDHPITESEFDVDYQGRQKISAWYAMLDLPITSDLTVVGGVRFEKTRIGIVNEAERDATWFPPGTLAPTQLTPGDADVEFFQDNTLPAVALSYDPIEQITLRAAYSKTVARQTFKELTPILQQEFLGGPIFIGNPALEMSELRNWDIRADYRPYQGGLVSVSWFRKDVKKPIEYTQELAIFDFITAVNYPRGRLQGFEFETRHDLGAFWEPLTGIGIGGNGTLIESEVTLPENEAAGFAAPGIQVDLTSRDMTAAPEYLYNLYLTYDAPTTGTRLGVFYTVQGDTLVAGAAEANGNFIPNIYARTFDTLNVSIQQELGPYANLRLQAKNLTNPDIEEVFRAPSIGADVTNTSNRRGIDYSISIGGQITF